MDPKKTELLVHEIIRPGKEEVACEPTLASDELGKKIIDVIYQIAGKSITIKDALKIFVAFLHGAESEYSSSIITGISKNTCKLVLDICYEHGLLNRDILND